MSLGSKLLTLHERLEAAGIAHAFGGAIALAYCTRNPRGTVDLDLNLFVGVEFVNDVIEALPEGVQVTEVDLRRIAADGQTRLWWGETPVDVFFSSHPFHQKIAKRVHEVTYEDRTIPVLDCTDLVVFKTLFARMRDWGDIAVAAANGSINVKRAIASVTAFLDADDDRVRRLREAIRVGRQTRVGPTVLPDQHEP